jgi:hypothetical protein
MLHVKKAHICCSQFFSPTEEIKANNNEKQVRQQEGGLRGNRRKGENGMLRVELNPEI